MRDAFFWDGYLHWAFDIEAKDPEFPAPDGRDVLFEPIFIRLKEEKFPPGVVRKVSRELSRLANDLDDGSETREAVSRIEELSFLQNFAFDLIELVIGFEHAVLEKKLPEFFIYREVTRDPTLYEPDQGLFTIIDVGAPARVSPAPRLIKLNELGGFRSPDVVGAVIDNDIGFLNRNFCSDDDTRFLGIWLQARERLSVLGRPTFKEVVIGEVLSATEINTMHAAYGRRERAAYAHLNDRLHSRTAFKRPPPSAAHGSMVADLAVGNRAGSEMEERPLLAVQLPPEAAQDTSGTTSESYIVQGVRWICFWARRLAPRAKVVINISYGSLAGQKDGGKFIEAQIKREIDLAKLYPIGQEVTVVFAFGNSKNERQVAYVQIAKDDTAELTWLIPFDNAAPSFADIRAVDETGTDKHLTEVPGDVRVALVSPSGHEIALNGSAGTTDVVAEPPVTSGGGTAAARIYNVGRRDFGAPHVQQGHTLAAVAPTRLRGHRLPVAEAGDWTVRLTNNGGAPVRIVCQIQRGDTAPGFRRGGQQSRFQGRLVPTEEFGIATMTVEPPLTNAGTNSAYANVAEFVTAGADRTVFGVQLPTVYSGQGADWTVEVHPDRRIPVDRVTTIGLPVSGAYSGSRERLSGTSAAAALCTRQIIDAI